jgi:hypothetical protein
MIDENGQDWGDDNIVGPRKPIVNLDYYDLRDEDDAEHLYDDPEDYEDDDELSDDDLFLDEDEEEDEDE